MNRRDLHYVYTQYVPGVDCECKANAYAWKLCEAHQAMEDLRHAEALAAHRPEVTTDNDWINS